MVLGTGQLIGLALQAGGVRGFSHIATLKTLREAGIEPDVIAGSSFGAVVGVLYAMYQDPSTIYGVLLSSVRRYVPKVDAGQLASPWTGFKMLFAESLFGLEEAYKLFRELFGKMKFSQLRTKVLVVSFDVEARQSVVHDEGYVVDAVLSSCTVPGVIQPTFLGGSKQLDGGVLSPVPVRELRDYGADVVISSTFHTKPETPRTHEDLLYYIDSLHERILIERAINESDFSFKYELDFGWQDFSKCESVYNSSLRQAQEVVPDLNDFVGRRLGALSR